MLYRNTVRISNGRDRALCSRLFSLEELKELMQNWRGEELQVYETLKGLQVVEVFAQEGDNTLEVWELVA